MDPRFEQGRSQLRKKEFALGLITSLALLFVFFFAKPGPTAIQDTPNSGSTAAISVIEPKPTKTLDYAERPWLRNKIGLVRDTLATEQSIEKVRSSLEKSQHAVITDPFEIRLLHRLQEREIAKRETLIYLPGN